MGVPFLKPVQTRTHLKQAERGALLLDGRTLYEHARIPHTSFSNPPDIIPARQ